MDKQIHALSAFDCAEMQIALALALEKIAKLEERIRVADAEEPVLLVVVEENDGGTLSHRISWSEANQLPLGYWPMFAHAQIPAEVELKAKIAELEAIIKISQEPIGIIASSVFGDVRWTEKGHNLKIGAKLYAEPVIKEQS